ncbi:hypothetical protein CCR75_007809 [Bremia lactucae]|uniref:Uncharacterized protein n=1 Tax=Bremia lactucae TaxID=4779 RepID=A0A976IBW5_BRELC|nr:hypothetical protein CCR75_007809 [Bremia lactucae]
MRKPCTFVSITFNHRRNACFNGGSPLSRAATPESNYPTTKKDAKNAYISFPGNQPSMKPSKIRCWRRSNEYETERAFLEGAKYNIADNYCGFTDTINCQSHFST